MEVKEFKVITTDKARGGGNTMSLHGVDSQFRVVSVKAEVLTKELTAFVSDFGGVLDNISPKNSEFDLKEIEISVTVSASGGIQLIGKCEGEIQGTIKLTFKRP